VNAKKFKAPFIAAKEIESETGRLRKEFVALQSIPVDVLGFAEFDLELDFEFAHIKQLGQEAFLRPDLTGIWFDTVAFTDADYKPRLRFSAAHELGHFFLHKEVYGSLGFTTVEQWRRFVDGIPLREYNWIEWQADEFAGRLLIPTERLGAALAGAVEDAKREGFFDQGKDEALSACARALHKDFGVSRSAMEIRIRKSGLWV